MAWDGGPAAGTFNMSLERCCPCVFRTTFSLLRLHPCRKPCIFESQDGAHNMGKERDVKLMGGTQRTWTRGGKLSREFSGSGLPNKGSIPPKAMVELSLSDHPLKEPSHMKAKTTLGIGGHTEVLGGTDSATQSLYFYHSSQEQQGQGGGLLGSYSCSLVQVGVTLQHPGGGRHQGEARASGWVHPLEEGGNTEAPPALGSFGISAVGAERAERWDSESERELDQPSRHRARHARFRRSESQLEKQAKVAKSKCKRIALLLTAAPNSKNKGVLMFEKHRERAKKYTLVSYGTGKEEPEPDDEEEAEEDYHRVKVTFLTDGETQPDKEAFANALGCGITVNFDKDCAPLNVDKKPDDQRGMEYLPETKGKGALMFARRRQRIDEIAAAHEEMRRKGIPVEGPPGPDNAEVTPSYQAEEYSYKQLPDSHPSKVNLGIQQHQAQPTMNGATHMQATDVQRFHVPNRTAQPFSGVPNRVPASFSPPVSTPSPVLDHPAYSESKHRVVPVSTRPQVLSPTDREQIVSRDERISVPAIKTGMLHDTKKRNTAKTAFRPKEFPTMSQILNPKGDKTAGFESSAEEDYLSLGAEACNFLQTPAVKHKTPPPVAPKPSINLACPPWSTNNTQLPLGSESPALATAPTVSPSQVSSAQQHTTTSTWSPPELHPPLQQPVSALDSPLSKVQSQPSGGFWGTSQHQAPTQPSWAQPCAPVSTAATAQSELRSSWNQPYISANAMASHLSQGLSSNIYGPKVRSVGSISSGRAMSPASDMPTMRGRGAELFAKRQSRMEKFVVDSETVQANKARAQSPTPSLPSAWKYSPNVRAPPPVSYNPLLTPSYPLAAIKQPPPSSSKAKPKSNVTGKSAPKHLNSLDVMKHQPYQLNASLFTYSPSLEEKDNSSASPGPTPTGQITKPTGPGACRSYSLPRRLPSMSSRPGYESTSSTPVFEPSCDPMERQISWLEKTSKPTSSWEATSRTSQGLAESLPFEQRRRSEGFYSAAKSPVSPLTPTAQYGHPFRQYQSQGSMQGNSTRYTGLSSGFGKPVCQPFYRPICNTVWRQ